MITKKQVMMVTIAPIIIFSILDLTTTYFGVCVFGGIELNVNAIKLVQKFGFIPGGLIWMFVNFLIGSLLAWFLWGSMENEISRTFMIVVIVLLLTDSANTIVLNINTLMYQNIGRGFAPRDSHEKDITPAQAEQIKETFVMEEFCRLI